MIRPAPDAPFVTARVDETEIDDVHPGQSVKIAVDAFPDAHLTGQVAEVETDAHLTGQVAEVETDARPDPLGFRSSARGAPDADR